LAPQAVRMMASPIIHVVDDDDAVRDSLAMLLEAEGLTVATYASGQAFLETVTGEIEGCLLADVQMAALDGLALLERLRACGWSPPAVLMTGRSSAGLTAQARRAGVSVVLDKPFTSKALLDALRDAIAAPR
jgi:two-component system response regulator FixJ